MFSKQAIAVYSTVSLAIYIKNRVQKSKTPVVLDDTTGKQDVVVIGGGLSGLASAYYLSQNERNNVILLEKNNKAALESSSCNGGLFQRHDCIPWTQRSIWRIVPGMWRISGP